MAIALPGRTYSTTDTGRVGIGPISLQPGDLICVILGVDVPFIVRPCENEKSRFAFLMWPWKKKHCRYHLGGECYASTAIMDGEFVARNLPIAEFVIL